MTRKKVEQDLKLQMAGWSGMYNCAAVNYCGESTPLGKDARGERLTEVVARWVCDHFKDFSTGIAQIERDDKKSNRVKGRPYQTKSHAKIRTEGVSTASDMREEERDAQTLYIASESPLWEIGSILDYQVPLKNSKDDVAGKIDLLSLSNDGRQLYILELKKQKSQETLLRCILEAYTYFKTIKNQKAFKQSFIDGNPELVICPLFYKGSQPDKDRKGKNRYLRNLVRKIQAEVPVKLMRIDKCGHMDDAKQWRIEEVDFEVGE